VTGYPEVCGTCDLLVANPHLDKKNLRSAAAP
jgi:hypothetical protein